MFKLNKPKKAFSMPNINKSMAASRRPHGLGIPKLKLNKGLAPRMPKLKMK